MSRPNPIALATVFFVFIAIFGGLGFLKGGLYLDTHEGDTYHLLDLLFRMREGMRPHLDFVTPLGTFAVLPMAMLMREGVSVGDAILWAQVGVALLLWLPVTYASWTRLATAPAYAFGALTLGLVLALTYGGADSGISISMHYNRWAWSAAFVLLALAVLPPRVAAPAAADGLLVGLLSAALLMIKITYFVAIVPIAALFLIFRRDWGRLVWALAGGAAVIVAATLVWGVGHWSGYVADLANVSRSEIRPFVGVPFNEIVAGPAWIGGAILGIVSYVLLRSAGHDRVAVGVVLLVGAFVYITYQNFGNDPQWLIFLPFVLLSLRPPEGSARALGMDTARAMTVAAGVGWALIFPSMANLALSPFDHLALDKSGFIPMLPPGPGTEDLYIRTDRANTMTAEIHLDDTSPVWAKYAADAERDDPLEIGGVAFPACELMAGSRAFFVEIAADLQAAGIPEGSEIYTTDVLTAFWLFGPYRPLRNGAPWYYGELSGLENADFVLVPKCSFVSRVRRIMVEELNAADVEMELVRDNELYALFALK